mmetsp:Transcript_19938/g.37038  ORF Transcript_19938/g.37038 Transcript_19938/m.37038 type:complete len:82 (-) Transcript_19938:133-378(-)
MAYPQDAQPISPSDRVHMLHPGCVTSSRSAVLQLVYSPIQFSSHIAQFSFLLFSSDLKDPNTSTPSLRPGTTALSSARNFF